MNRQFEEQITPEQKELLHKLADKIVHVGMTTPAILFLESFRPLNFVGSQLMVFFAPMVKLTLGMPEWDMLQQALEKRESIEYFIDLIEEKDNALVEERAKKTRLKLESKAK